MNGLQTGALEQLDRGGSDLNCQLHAPMGRLAVAPASCYIAFAARFALGDSLMVEQRTLTPLV